MKKNLTRTAHFLGTKIRNLRKRNNLTMEDLSARCIKIDPEAAPSVSYLSMIERGKRVPSEGILDVIAQVFQKEVQWFLDDAPDEQAITPLKNNRGGISGMALEPSFLFSDDILQIAIPEMLSQTGTTGREFAHLLIRAHQEHHQNHFPDLERAAEAVGLKRMPLSVEDLIAITKDLGLEIHWFKRPPENVQVENGHQSKSMLRSFFEAPNRIYINERIKNLPARLKYDLALHIGHCVLHEKGGVSSAFYAGSQQGGTPSITGRKDWQSSNMDAQDILHAWRDFECSFFAGALLCPRAPFRQLLDRHSYEVDVCDLVGVSASVAMRRMTAVSPYPHWHYFDAYSMGAFKAVYRGNGIPLPWGNLRQVENPCQHWAVFRMINTPPTGSSAQISIIDVQGEPRIYACESLHGIDLASNPHVLCAGIDLNPAILAQGKDPIVIAEELKAVCVSGGGSVPIPKHIQNDLMSVAKILNIAWVERGIENNAQLICSRSVSCPREPNCYGVPNAFEGDPLGKIQQEIINSLGRH